MKTDLNVIASNLINAAYNHEIISIGGGLFAEDELKEASQALKILPKLTQALYLISLTETDSTSNMNEKVQYMAQTAKDALKETS